MSEAENMNDGNAQQPVESYRGKLLIQEPPLQVLPTLASILGLGPSIFLQQIHWWMQFGGGEKYLIVEEFDGRLWARVPPKILKKKFRFLDHRTLQRYISALEKMGVLLTENYNENRLDTTNWYSVNYEQLQKLEDAYNEEPDPDGSDDNVVSRNDILSLPKATQKKPATKRRNGNDILSLPRDDKMSLVHDDKMSLPLIRKKEREEVQQQDSENCAESVVVPAVVPAAVVDFENSKNNNGNDLASRIAKVVEILKPFKLAAKTIRTAALENIDHAEYVAHEFPGEEEADPQFWIGRQKGSIAGALRLRLENPAWQSTRDQERADKKQQTVLATAQREQQAQREASARAVEQQQAKAKTLEAKLFAAQTMGEFERLTDKTQAQVTCRNPVAQRLSQFA